MDWLAGLFELVGSFLVGEKKKICFIFSLIGNILWVAYAFINGHTYGLLIVVIPAAVINTINYFKWSKDVDKK